MIEKRRSFVIINYSILNQNFPMKTFFIICALFFSISVCTAQPFWQEVPSGTTTNLNSVSFGSDNVGYIGGNDSLILKSINGGETWFPLQTTGLNLFAASGNIDIIHVEFVNEMEGYIAVNNADTLAFYTGGIYKTVDGGVTWAEDYTNMCSAIKTLHLDDTTGYSIGASCFGGRTITKKENGVWSNNPTYLSWNIEYLKAIDFFDVNRGIVGGDSALIFRTFDGGVTWDTIDLNLPLFGQNGGSILDLQYINDSTIVMANSIPGKAYYISTDNGLTWTQEGAISFASPRMKSIAIVDTDTIITVGAGFGGNQGIVYSTHKATNYFHEQHFPTGVLNSITVVKNPLAIAVGDNGLIISNKRTSTSTANFPRGFPKINIYPNPASEQITVESENMTQIEIIDVLGRVVKTIEALGHSQKTIDISQFQRGVFLLKVYFKNGQTICKEVAVF